MKELLVISGKGGTGKTSVVASFAALADSKVLADCDVDAADLHLLLSPEELESHEFIASRLATLDKEKCIGCGRCSEVCRFDAIAMADGYPVIDPISCEGCNVCSFICPEGAITMVDAISGHWYVSNTRFGPMVHAKLKAAEENSGKLVSQVRRKAREIAESQGLECIITDGPPGVGCPVISSISGVDLALIVTEPTVAGVHDMERVLDLTRHFDVNAAVCINKCDLDEANTERIEDYCCAEEIEVVGKIPFDEEMVKAVVRGEPPVTRVGGGHGYVEGFGPGHEAGSADSRRCPEGSAAQAIRRLWDKVEALLEQSAETEA
jgi:MinD superfamily P-loop ATPase